jgi:DNA-binding PadR family transcriptional regulator
MAASAAWGADDGPFDIFKCVGDVLTQVREDLGATVGASWDQVREDLGAMAGGSWEDARERARSFSGRKDRGHWGGGFGGGWWPSPPGGPGGPGGPGFSRQSSSARGTKASRGDVRAAILALLREGPRNGYQIMSEIDERSGGAWRPSPGAVYPALSQLADEGLIVGEESDGKRTFRLTDAGREYIEQHPERARGAWESAEQQEAWEVPGLFAEAARLGAGIVQMAHAGTNEQVVAAERLLQRTRRELYRLLADDTDDADDADDTDEAGDAGQPDA